MKSTLIRASVTILGTIGLLAAPAVAHAFPPLPLAPQCAGIWGFDGESTIFEPDTGWNVTFFSNGRLATGDATASNNRGESKTGSVRGGITEDNRRYNVSVDYDNGQYQLYSGRVGPDGVATGATNNGITLESGKRFTSRLVCLPA
jgi:hypothetical protein